jgi:hypothetical protein
VIAVLLGNGDGSFQAPTFFATGASGTATSLAVGDFNGDGRPDLVTANPSSGTITVLLNDGHWSVASGSGSGGGGSAAAIVLTPTSTTQPSVKLVQAPAPMMKAPAVTLVLPRRPINDARDPFERVHRH